MYNIIYSAILTLQYYRTDRRGIRRNNHISGLNGQFLCAEILEMWADISMSAANGIIIIYYILYYNGKIIETV